MHEQLLTPADTFELLREILRQATAAGVMQKKDRFGLTYIQRNVLLFISRRDECSPAEIARSLSLLTPAVTRIITSLERKGLLLRSKNTKDRRMKSLTLTPHTRQMISRMDDHPTKLLTTMIASISPEQQQAMTKGLNILLTGLKKIT